MFVYGSDLRTSTACTSAHRNTPVYKRRTAGGLRDGEMLWFLVLELCPLLLQEIHYQQRVVATYVGIVAPLLG